MKAAQTPYVYQAYPKYLYHPSGETRIVQNALEHQQLAPGWYDTPAAFTGGVVPVTSTAGIPVGVIPTLDVAALRRLLAEAEAHEAAAKAAAERQAVAEAARVAETQQAAEATAAAADQVVTARLTEQTKEAAEMQAVYEAPAAALIQATAGSSPESLTRLRAIESANPKGARKAVLKAVEMALAKLAPATQE